MASLAAAAPLPSAAAARRPWFFGPAPDLLFGCGLLYACFFAAQAFAGPPMRELLPLALLPFVTLLFGTPHYGATLLRVYEQRADRRKYAIFSVWATLALAAAYVVGLHQLAVGSFLVTLYLTWSPWHYSGQNYGIALLFLRRRGVAISPGTKRFLYAAFVFSYLLVFLALHGEKAGLAIAPDSYRGTVFDFLSLGIPLTVQAPLFLLCALGWMVSLGGAAWGLVPGARLRDLVPTALVVATQALWFALPTLAIQWNAFPGVEPFRYEFRPYAFMWVALGHFLQYLWITTFYAAASGNTGARIRYLGKTLLAGAALWVAPTLLFAPGGLASLPLDMGLALLTASVVNLHHFILDGAIWKLRDGRIARVLLRSPGSTDDPGDGLPPAERRAWIPRLVWALGAFCLLVSLGLKIDAMLAHRALQRGDVERFRASNDLRAWFGRDSPKSRVNLALIEMKEGRTELALADLQRSIALHPTPEAFFALGTLHEQRGAWQEALGAYEAALGLDPKLAAAHLRSAVLLRQLGRADLARAALERARALEPADPRARKLLDALPASEAPPAAY